MILFKSLSLVISVVFGMFKWLVVICACVIYFLFFSETFKHRFPSDDALQAAVAEDVQKVAAWEARQRDIAENSFDIRALRDWSDSKVGVFNVIGLLCHVPRDQDQKDNEAAINNAIGTITSFIPLDKLGPLGSVAEWATKETANAIYDAVKSTDYSDQVVLYAKSGTSLVGQMPAKETSYYPMSAGRLAPMRANAVTYNGNLIVEARDAFNGRDKLDSPHKLGTLDIKEDDDRNDPNEIAVNKFSEKESSEYYLYYQNFQKAGPNNPFPHWDLNYDLLSRHWTSFRLFKTPQGRPSFEKQGVAHSGGLTDSRQKAEDSVKRGLWNTFIPGDGIGKRPEYEYDYTRQIVQQAMDGTVAKRGTVEWVWNWPKRGLFSGVVTHVIRGGGSRGKDRPVRIEWVDMVPRGAEQHMQLVCWIDQNVLDRLKDNQQRDLILGSSITIDGKSFSKKPPPKSWFVKGLEEAFSSKPTPEQIVEAKKQRDQADLEAFRIMERWKKYNIQPGQSTNEQR